MAEVVHGVIGKDSLQYVVQIIASLVARQAAMAVQDTQITVFHESAAQGGGNGDCPAGVTRFHSLYAELVLSDVGNLFGWP